MSDSMIVERAEERLSVSRLGKSSHRETDKDLVVIADLLAEVKQLEGEVFAWRMRNHKLADEVKAALATLAELDQARAGRDMWGRTANALGGNMEDVGHILSGVRYDEAEDVYRAANRVVAERDAALATLREVRDMHTPHDGEWYCGESPDCETCASGGSHEGQVCTLCTHEDWDEGGVVIWPCHTARLIDAILDRGPR